MADRPYSRVYTFEDVWAAMMESKERHKEIDRQMQETDRKFQETERFMKKLGKQMGDLHHRFGEMAAHLVAPSIAKRFNELGYRFDGIATQGQIIYDEQGKIKAEIDILLENGDCIIAVEVKARVVPRDIEHHIKRLGILRESRNKQRDKRKILGAIAGAIFESIEKKAALDAGFYVLEQSGDTMKLEIPEGFALHEW